MDRQTNIEYGKRMLVDSIWKEANIEGIAVTYPDTEAVIRGSVATGMKTSDVVTINNLKHAWQYVFDNIDARTDLLFLRQLNDIIGANLFSGSGVVREFDVNIGGTSWKPDIPTIEGISSIVRKNSTIEDPTARAIDLFCSLCRLQAFPDGNKRTAQLAANKELVANGAGILSVPIDKQGDFFCLLVRYYETNDSDQLKRFLKKTCVSNPDIPDAATFEKARKRQDRDIARTIVVQRNMRNQSAGAKRPR